MKILVTGSSGHLGEALVRELQKTTYYPVGIDLNPSAFTTHVGTITDRSLVDSVVKGVDYIIHTATLHKPHVATHTYQDFIDTNITGTLNLLEAAVAHHVQAFIYTSTTSTFGDILTPQLEEPAVWVTEQTLSIPKNIYGVTKSAAEDLCQLFCRNHKLPTIVLKTSRFFPEEDDKKELRDAYEDVNLRANELLYRRVDLADAVAAHLLAIEQVEKIGFAKYIISATSPFQEEHLSALNTDAVSVVQQLYPDFAAIYQQKGWRMNPRIDRVYVNEKARTELGWQSKYDFRHVLDCLKEGKDFQSPLAKAVGKKGYHDQKFTEGPYPVTND
ncbi:MAG: NAD(P)-dependent oxidoreductase [Bacteroidota bacterium]